jgi:hypothetical protein
MLLMENKIGEDFQRMYLQLAILQLFNLRVAILSLGIALNWNNSFRVCRLTGGCHDAGHLGR